jgi:hypothetical protein
MKPFIFVDFNNSAKFRNNTYWSTYDTRNYHFRCQVNIHHIGNKDLSSWIM